MKINENYKKCLTEYNDFVNWITKTFKNYQKTSDLYDKDMKHYSINNIDIVQKDNVDKVIVVSIKENSLRIKYKFILTKNYFYYIIDTNFKDDEISNTVISIHFNETKSPYKRDIGYVRDIGRYTTTITLFLYNQLRQYENRI